MEAFGVPDDVAAGILDEEREQESFDVYADNWESVAAFALLETQWRIAVGATRVVWLGIDYGSVPVILDALEVTGSRRSELFADLRLMERAALAVRNEQADASDG